MQNVSNQLSNSAGHNSAQTLGKKANQRLLVFFFTVNKANFLLTAALLLLVEMVICHLVIQRVSYTEIDWKTYMQQVRVYLKGQRNYTLIEGSTGPLVYPAAHLYIYRVLYSLTEKGKNVRRAQFIFAVLYLTTLLLVFRLFYNSRRIPPFVLCLICLSSYRVHSIFLLRLFNDPIAILLFFGALNFFISQQWLPGCVLYSLAVGVKMNILLFAPALFFILLLSNNFAPTCWHLSICALIQGFCALEFLTVDAWAYLSRAFELSRVFMFKWTVNWRLLPLAVFLDRRFHLALLLCHLAFLVILATKLWFGEQGGLPTLLRRLYFGIRTRFDAHDILYTLFTCNFAGILFARSLHYQFYCWYYHSIPYLLFAPLYPPTGSTMFKSNSSTLSPTIPVKQVLLRLPILFGLELCWNTYPSTVLSSFFLHCLHATMVYLLFTDSRQLSDEKMKQ